MHTPAEKKQQQQAFQRQQTNNRGSSPLRKERIDDSVSQRIDGQLWDPLEIFSTADRRCDQNIIPTRVLRNETKRNVHLKP